LNWLATGKIYDRSLECPVDAKVEKRLNCACRGAGYAPIKGQIN